MARARVVIDLNVKRVGDVMVQNPIISVLIPIDAPIVYEAASVSPINHVVVWVVGDTPRARPPNVVQHSPIEGEQIQRGHCAVPIRDEEILTVPVEPINVLVSLSKVRLVRVGHHSRVGVQLDESRLIQITARVKH